MNKTVQQSFRLIMGRMVEGSNPGAGKIFLSREISVVQRGSSLHVFCYIKKSRDGPSLLSSSFPKKKFFNVFLALSRALFWFFRDSKLEPQDTKMSPTSRTWTLPDEPARGWKRNEVTSASASPETMVMGWEGITIMLIFNRIPTAIPPLKLQKNLNEKDKWWHGKK